MEFSVFCSIFNLIFIGPIASYYHLFWQLLVFFPTFVPNPPSLTLLDVWIIFLLILIKQVSKLLAVIYVLSSTSKLFSLSSSSKVLSESHWASFFHQASLGTHLNYKFLSNMSWRFKAQDIVDTEVCLLSS